MSSLAIFVHPEAERELATAGFPLNRLTGALVRETSRRDNHSASRTWRRLRGPLASEWRLRLASSHRAICNCGWRDGELHAVFVHAVAPRARVYKDAATLAGRLRTYWQAVADQAGDPLRVAREIGYHSHEARAEPGAESIEAHLSERQQEVLDLLVPKSALGETNAVVVLGEGPPGSGKSLIAMEAVVEAKSEGWGVVVLTPTEELGEKYRRHFRIEDVPVQPLDTPGEGVQVWRTETWFATTAGIRPDSQRYDRLRDWWAAERLRGCLRVESNRDPRLGLPEMPYLVDGLLEDPVRRRRRERDGIQRRYREAESAVDELRLRKRDALAKSRAEAGLLLRCEIAERARTALTHRESEGERLLIVVDEVQDLIPSEWRALVEWVIARDTRGLPTRLALLGDANQRISATAFAWEDVTDVLQSLGATRFKKVQVEHRTFRLNQAVATLANITFNPAIHDRADTRSYPVADPHQSPPGGSARVVCIDGAVERVRRVLASRERASSPDLRTYIVDASGSEATLDGVSGVHWLPVRLAKGLEYRSTIVLNPFARRTGDGVRLGQEEAVVAYTALSRSWDSVLCIVDPSEVELLAPVIGELGDAGVSTERDVLSDEELAKLLEAYAHPLDIEEEKQTLAVELREALRAAMEGSEPAHARRVQERATDLLSLAAVARVAEIGRELVNENGGVAREFLQLAHRACQQKHLLAAIAMLVLLGEHAAAFRLADRCEEVAGAVHDGLFELLDDADGWQSWAYDVGESMPESELSESTANVAERAMLREVWMATEEAMLALPIR